MMSESETLSASEQAYFDTQGASVPETSQPAPEAPRDPSPRDDAPVPATPKAEPAAEPRDDKVPLSVLLEERRERKALEAQLAEYRKPKAAPAPEPEAIPEFDQDPRGYIKGNLTQTQRELAELRQWKQQQEQAVQHQSQVTQIQRAVVAQEAEFAKTTPDYNDAAQHMLSFRRAQLAAMGYDDGQVAQTIQSDLMGIVAAAQQRGQSVPQMVYGLAKASGYTAKQAQAAADAVAAPEPTADRDGLGRYKSVERLNRGADFASPTASGAAPDAKMTQQRLLEMSHSQFNDFAEKNPDVARKLMGG